MPKKRRKPDKSIHTVLVDWEGKEVLLTHAVFSGHVANAAHDEAYEYFETLKEHIAHPESVVRSKNRQDTLIANIRLENRRHQYLRVVIRYGTVWERLLGKQNYIVTFYGAAAPKEGERYEHDPL
jgi:hypothetical protein